MNFLLDVRRSDFYFESSTVVDPLIEMYFFEF